MEKLKTNLRFKITLPVMVILVALSATVICSERQIEFGKLSDQHRADVNRTNRLMAELLDDEAIVYARLADQICQDNAIQQTFLDGDREALLELTEASYTELNSLYNVTHLYFHQLDKTCFLRTHTPSRFGDVIERHTLASAMQQGTPFCGVELGPLGTLTFRYVQPWRVDGTLIGFVELGEEIGAITRDLKKILGFEFVMTVNKSNLNRADWQENRQKLDRTDWDLLDDSVIISHTFDGFPADISGNIKKECLQKGICPQVSLIMLNDKKQMIGCFGLTDPGGTQVGRMFVIQDMSVPAAIIDQSSAFFGAMILVTGFCASVFFYFYIGRIEKRLKETHKNQQIEITHRRFAEAQLTEAKDRAEATNRAKSQFMANMSHELRTPMNAIIGFSELLKDEMVGEEQLDYIETICASGQHLLSLINNVLDIAKIESGKEQIVLGMCSPHQMVGQLENLIRTGAESKGLCFAVEIAPGVPEQIFTDAGHLYQCLINLMGNAIKFTKQGSVTLRVTQPNAADPSLCFEVADTGIGIPEDRLETVFESFEQADASTSRKYGGTGLGLAISKKLIEMMGGTLTVESAEGIGSIFTLTLPLEPAAKPVAQPVA